MTEKTAKPAIPCDVTVTVSGAQGSGKSHLIAVLAQALRGAGHTAITQDHIPSALKAISDLSKPYNVTFVEADPALREEAISTLNDAADEITALRAKNEELGCKVASDRDKLNEFRAANIGLAKTREELSTMNEGLKARVERQQIALADYREASAALTKELSDHKVMLTETRIALNGKTLPEAEIARLVNTACTYLRDATIIEQSRHDLTRRADDLKAESAKLRNEAEAREREARAMIRHAITGVREPAATAAQIQMERRTAARNLSASDKLAIANGADPSQIGGAAGTIVAAALDEHTLEVAEDMAEVAAEGYAEAADTSSYAVVRYQDHAHTREATLASTIERTLFPDMRND